MPPKRKPTRRSNKGRPTPKRSRSRRQPHVIELPLRQGLLEMATIGAHSFLWVVLAAATVAVAVGLIFVQVDGLQGTQLATGHALVVLGHENTAAPLEQRANASRRGG